jgi:hypothetical protein
MRDHLLDLVQHTFDLVVSTLSKLQVMQNAQLFAGLLRIKA